MDVWKQPRTDEMESIKVLVWNCQQRRAYANREQIRSSDDDDEDACFWVDIPEPGVPANYLGITVSSTSSSSQQADQLTTDR